MDYLEYMKIPLALFPEWVKKKIQFGRPCQGWIYLLGNQEVSVGTPPSWAFGQQTPWHYKYVNIPRLWKHTTCPITFSFMVDDFGIKYVGKEHVEHLINSLKEDYKLTKDWTGNLYCGISLNWNHANEC